jgi:putative methionine-R-sulfoxide reductase with GAF domain
MDHHPILDKNPSQAMPETASSNVVPSNVEPKAESAPTTAVKHETLRFPGEDGGKSLSEMAKRDLDATLQLLAERAQYITGASGAAIAMREDETMICCARAGPSAPDLGAELQIDSGLSAESVRTRRTLRCDDAANDLRVNRESCRAFGIASVVVMPLIRGAEVYGVFELLSGRPHAFEERDFVALERVAEMIQTAVEHAEAVKRAEKELGSKQEPRNATIVRAEPQTVKAVAKLAAGNSKTSPDQPAPAVETKTKLKTGAELGFASEKARALAQLRKIPHTKQEGTGLASAVGPIEYGNVRRCDACGFPVSEGRKLCLDCEAANPEANPGGGDAPEFLGQLSDANSSWLRSHMYLIATLLVLAATIAVLVWRR